MGGLDADCTDRIGRDSMVGDGPACGAWQQVGTDTAPEEEILLMCCHLDLGVCPKPHELTGRALGL